MKQYNVNLKGPEWEGLTLEEIRYARVLAQTRIEINREILLMQPDKSTAVKPQAPHAAPSLGACSAHSTGSTTASLHFAQGQKLLQFGAKDAKLNFFAK